MDINNLTFPKDQDIFNSFVTLKSKLENPNYKNIMVSISGGADSDLLIDMIAQLKALDRVRLVWFDTGLEYQATKDHLRYLELKYNTKIETIKAVKPIPSTCKEYGQPFLSKQVSEYMYRLQLHNFKWEDKSFEELYKEYPKCKIALLWWCNMRGENSAFNIDRNKWLKEFIINNPPKFRISNKCCEYAKKKVKHKYIKDNKVDLSIVGVRKAEGGARAYSYKNCFTAYNDNADEYRPIFWYKNKTKEVYEKYYNVKHSECYSTYGLKRTGCCGCPYSKEFEKELEIMQRHEPKLYKAATYIFKDAYEYTRAYKKFCEVKNNAILYK